MALVCRLHALSSVAGCCQVTGYEAEIVYSDGNDNILEKHGYRATDFPLDELRLYFVNDTLMLPSEY